MVLRVPVLDAEYDMCEKSSHNQWSNEKTGPWGRGHINTTDDPHKTNRIGKLGEMALAKVHDKPVDLDYHKGGDAGDFILLETASCKITANIKTAAHKPPYAAGLIRVVSDRGVECL